MHENVCRIYLVYLHQVSRKLILLVSTLIYEIFTCEFLQFTFLHHFARVLYHFNTITASNCNKVTL